MLSINKSKIFIFLACLFSNTQPIIAQDNSFPFDRFNSQSVNSNNQDPNTMPQVNTWQSQNNIDTFATASPAYQNLNVPITMQPVFCNEPLQSKIATNRELPAVPPELRTGAVFNEANLPPMRTNQSWRRMPSWAPGTWHREMQIIFLPTGTKTILSRSVNDQQDGEQVDRYGGIWKHISLPRKTTVENNQNIEYQITINSELIMANETQTIQRTRFIGIEVSKRNNKIIKVLQKEEFDTIRPEGQRAIIKDGWLTIYNERGKRLGSLHSQAHYSQIRIFEPINIDSDTGLDLHQDFKNYLLSHGLAHLVPIDDTAQLKTTQTDGFP